ncbi:hypothetical protein CTI12_AA102440 [Artemisia annua]|uniref:Uncharacterized protein n=1 Tax=Artemisia annua TaxID=35608 RepID=A0A2U1PWU7_ARTAN|nr:hypothetical protein CTI12_AA102440 [Artemisia annua]
MRVLEQPEGILLNGRKRMLPTQRKPTSSYGSCWKYWLISTFYGTKWLDTWTNDDKVTVIESEKKAWENSPEAQAMREALNPWRKADDATKHS